MNWNQIVDKIKPYVVKIKTPSGSGTGFLSLYNYDKSWCGIATASHVVDDVDEWQQPIKVVHHASEKPIVFLKEADRVIFRDPKTDSAIIFFPTPENLSLPNELVRIRPLDKILDIGSEVGWLGYPYLEEDTPCFFSGCISARNEEKKYYLIDGVAINGVSGGPVLFSTETDGVEVIGIVSAYMANRATGTALPGLSVAQDVSHLHGVVQTINSLDEARQKKHEMKEKEKNNGEVAIKSPDATPETSEQAT